jgi:AcrR family transcriptional regulator
MAPRPYHNTLRRQAQEATARRIVLAAVELHGRQGAMATTHAEIAELAGVSVATVYKHFPTRDALIPHCTGHVAADAPPLDPAALRAIGDPAARLRALAEAIDARHHYLHPWLRWAEPDAAALPALREVVAAGHRRAAELCDAALDGLAVPPATRALVHTLLDYSAWRRMHEKLDNRPLAQDAIAGALQAIVLGTAP